LGLKARPPNDSDVRARRLTQADPGLAKVLYGNVDTMRAKYPMPPSTPKAVVSAKPKPAAGGKPKATAGAKPAAGGKPKATAGAKPATKPGKGSAASDKPTAAGAPKSIAELRKRGYRQVGSVTQGTSARKLAGAKWNAADTYYTIRNKVVPGNVIDDAHIERGMGVWMKK